MIRTEAEYEVVLERIVKGAIKIKDPLLSSEERDRFMILYDELVWQARQYQAREYSRLFPHMRPGYVAMGLIGEDEKL
jgi:hypothetical protein